MKICHNCGRELRDTVKNCVRCNEEQFDDAVIFKSDPKPPPEVKIRKTTQPIPTDLPQQQQAQQPAQDGVPPYQQPNEPAEPFVAPQQEPFVAPQQEPFVAPQQEPFVAPQQEPFVAPQQEPVTPQQEPQVNNPVTNENTAEAIPFNSATEQPQENPATEQNAFQYVSEQDPNNSENVIDVATSDVEVDEDVLNTIIEEELAKKPEPKKTSVSVLILFILLFIITILIVQPFLLDKLASNKTNIVVTAPSLATPTVTPAETPDTTTDNENATTLPATLPYSQFIEGEYLGKATSELEAFYGSQTDTDIEAANNRTIYNIDYNIVVDTADDLTTISNIAFLSEETLGASTDIDATTPDATNTEATEITTLEDNITSITKVYELFKLAGTPIAINSTDENVIVDLATISVEDFAIETFEPTTYEAIFKLDDAKVNIGASYTLEDGIYSVSQSVIFSNFTSAVVEGDGTSPAISIPVQATEHPESEVVTSATP